MIVVVEGASRVGQRLARVAALEPSVAAGVLYRSAEEILTQAKRLTPVDTGALRASGHVQLPVSEPTRGVGVELGFGGVAGAGNQGGESNPEDVGYALIVHEDLLARHTVGQPKYLEVPVRAAVQTVTQQLAAATAQSFARSAQAFAKGESVAIGLG